MNELRVQNYLSTYNFQSNNIDFRIVSSKAMEHFKNLQSFQLGQLVNGKFYFSQKRRELLLLEYDLCTRWLMEVESSIIENSEIDLETIISLGYKSQEMVDQIIIENHLKFDIEFTEIFKSVHENVFDYLVEIIRTIDTKSVGVFFTKFVDNVIRYMDHTLIEIHELNTIIPVHNKIQKNKDGDKLLVGVPQLYVTNFSINIFNTFNESAIKHRIETYKLFFEFDCIIIKNFSDSIIPKNIFLIIEDVIKIDYKGCIR